MAYVFIAVLFPIIMFLTKQADWPPMKPTGLIFASLAGAAGAIGALMVIYAAKAAGQGTTSGGRGAAVLPDFTTTERLDKLVPPAIRAKILSATSVMGFH